MQPRHTISRVVLVLIGLWLLGSAPRLLAEEEAIPTTVEGGAATIKEGGREIGEGFKGIGRGIRDVFTGESSKENFREGRKIGTGVVDLGRGIGGVGRGTGRGIRRGFEDEGQAASGAPAPIVEEKLDE